MIGREFEKGIIQNCLDSKKSEFIVVYGRRRIGKTYLIRNFVNSKFTMYATGLENAKAKVQLATFNGQLREYNIKNLDIKDAANWIEAFKNLIKLLVADKTDVKIIFFDELPWLDNKNSGFLTALEFFWNSWASAQTNIKLIVCGSSASWMLQKLIQNKKGLYNRVTQRIKLKPFTLKETNEYFLQMGANYDMYQVIQLYMAIGGIPYYMDKVDTKLSAQQNINNMFFGENASLKNEYHLLFASLFSSYEKHIKIVETLATKKRGMYKQEIIETAKLADGGSLTKILNELNASDFIHKYRMPGKKSRELIYKLTDNYVMFYHNFLKNSEVFSDVNNWTKIINTPAYNSWQGNAFELVCMQHINEIKTALGISGILCNIYAWRNKNAQIDLIIDRSDNVINLIEIKFTTKDYTITKDYAENLANKVDEIRTGLKTKKAIWLVLLTTNGLSNNMYVGNIHSQLKMDIFFSK